MLENKDRISVRLTKREKQRIELLVSQGKYKDKTSFVRQAIKSLLEIETPHGTQEENQGA